MSSLAESIGQLEVQIGRLMSDHKALAEANRRLLQENAQLEQKLQYSQSELETIREENKTMKVARTLAGAGAETTATKLKINELVREIDKCLALLNR